MDNKFVAAAKTAETMTFRPTPEIYRAIRKVCGDLCINGQEFLRRAVVRELLYNGKKAK
jgi:hypothetical protein